MWRSSVWTAILVAAALLGGGPALADHDDDWDDDWDERYYEPHKKKGKAKGKDDSGYYVYYYIPRDFPAPAVCDCSALQPAPLSREDRASVQPPAPRAYGRSPNVFPKESRDDRMLAAQRQRGDTRTGAWDGRAIARLG